MDFDLRQIAVAAPLIAVVLGGLFLLMLEAFADGRQKAYLMPLTVAVCAIALLLEWKAWGEAGTPGTRLVFGGMLSFDRMSIFLDGTFLVAAALAAMLAAGFMREHGFEFGELYAMLMFATSGMMILGAATDLVTIFLGIETMSIAVYVLTGSWRRSPRSSEGAMKYFVTGAVASAVLLYGIALIYGAAGSTSLRVLSDKATVLATNPLFIIGMLMLVVAIGFKVAAVPLHMWAPDAYEGAPTPVTAFMAAGVKAAAFGTAIRLFGGAFAKSELAFGASGWATVLSVASALTMTIGNLSALRQENIKRMLAWSSIAHAGYLLLGVVAISLIGNEAKPPLLYYLAAYTFTTLGAFGVVAWIGSRGEERVSLEDWAGLASRHPGAALAMTLFMLSLGGIPPTAGFFGKLYVFRAALGRPGMLPLVIVAVLNSVVSVAYYLRVITAMYFREVGKEPKPIASRGMVWALAIAALGTLFLGLMPSGLLSAATAAAGL
jgi:NADH-quinone oxidoreductase subunit N